MLPSTKENEKNNFYLSGILLEQDKKAFALKVNKQNGFYYTFDMSTINDTFIISKDDTLIFQIFKKF